MSDSLHLIFHEAKDVSIQNHLEGVWKTRLKKACSWLLTQAASMRLFYCGLSHQKISLTNSQLTMKVKKIKRTVEKQAVALLILPK